MRDGNKLIYDPIAQAILIDGEWEPFNCGYELNPIAESLARLYEGTLSLQDAYDYIIENIDYEHG